jgi:hypothetical protein
MRVEMGLLATWSPPWPGGSVATSANSKTSFKVARWPPGHAGVERGLDSSAGHQFFLQVGARRPLWHVSLMAARDGGVESMIRLLVFVNDEGVAYNWRWDKADPDEPTLPVGYQTRFRKRLR